MGWRDEVEGEVEGGEGVRGAAGWDARAGGGAAEDGGGGGEGFGGEVGECGGGGGEGGCWEGVVGG